VLNVSFNHFAVTQIITILPLKISGFMLFSYTSKNEIDGNFDILFSLESGSDKKFIKTFLFHEDMYGILYSGFR
jgi:hypothetical protein